MPPIKFRERLTKFMISIALSEKFCCQNLITSIKVINMTRNSSKSNKLRNINTIGCLNIVEENEMIVHEKKSNIAYNDTLNSLCFNSLV